MIDTTELRETLNLWCSGLVDNPGICLLAQPNGNNRWLRASELLSLLDELDAARKVIESARKTANGERWESYLHRETSERLCIPALCDALAAYDAMVKR